MIRPPSMILAQLSWPEIKFARSRARVCVVPLGSLEQHGPHLPLWTDTAIVSGIASRIEQRLPDEVVLAPTQPIGYSPHHAHFGCVSLDIASYMAVIKDLCHSFAAMGFDRVLLLNGHGGNDVPCRAALCETKVEIPDLRVVLASYWTLAAEAFGRIRTSPPGGMNHACEMESSIMLALHPDQVNLSAAQDDGPLEPRLSATIRLSASIASAPRSGHASCTALLYGPQLRRDLRHRNCRLTQPREP